MKNLVFVLCCLLFVQTAFAQTTLTPQEEKVRKEVLKRGVSERSKVKVHLLDGTKIKGHISKISEDGFEVTEAKTSQIKALRFGEAKKVTGPGLSKGAKIGIGAAIAGGIAIAILAAIASAYGELLEGL
jgi:hypothetical protein